MFPNKRISVMKAQMAYIDVGHGDPIVFLHGNPTSSYLWRNIIPHLGGNARCLAPDLIGMGASDKVSNCQYRFKDHAQYLDAWFRAVIGNAPVTLVVHDWGSALGFDWARRHPDRVKGIVHFESITAPADTKDTDEGTKWFYDFFRSDEGERAVLENNMFIEKILLEPLETHLTDGDRAAYRKPWLTPGENRRPMITWPQEIPVDGAPADTTKIVTAYQSWMEHCEIPKLFLLGDPPAIMTPGEGRLEAARRWANQTEITVPGDAAASPAANHYLQEICPDVIGCAIAQWYGAL